MDMNSVKTYKALVDCNYNMDVFMCNLFGEEVIDKLKKSGAVDDDWQLTHIGLKCAHELGCF